MSTQKLRDMNLHDIADELEQLREFKVEVESQKPSLYKVLGKYRGGPSGTFYYDASDAGRSHVARHKEYGDKVVEYFSRPVPVVKTERITEHTVEWLCKHKDLKEGDLFYTTLQAVEQEPTADKFVATFRCESNGVVGSTNAPIYSVNTHDDGVVEVVTDRWPEKPAPDVLRLVEALEELVVLMEDTYQGEYFPDSLTTQPARIALDAYLKGAKA